jgi:hypothetical protein
LQKLRAGISHTALAVAEAGLIATLVVGLLAGTALAGKGGKPSGGGSTTGGGAISLVAPDGTANYGDVIRFNISTSNLYPVVSLTCSQGGTLVYSDSRPYYQPNIWNDPGDFTLRSLAWTGGAASCTALLKGQGNRGTVTLGSTSFSVAA